MKKTKIVFFLIILLCHFTDDAYCQLKFGVKGGLGLTNGTFEFMDGDYALRFHGGFLTEIPLTKRIYMRPELLFAQKGWRVPDHDYSVTLNYLNMPIMAGYKLFDGLSVSTGPELGLLLSARSNPSGFRLSDFYEKFDMGWALGCSYFFTEKIGIDLRYVYGFKGLIKGEMRDVNNNKLSEFRDGSNRAIQISAVYFFRGAGI